MSKGWRPSPLLGPVKRRVQRLQRVYWKYFRPLYCELIPTPEAMTVLVVAPHIDDDVIGCGGVLQQHAVAGATVSSVYLRDGGETREAEAREAGRLIGIQELIFLRWDEGRESGSWLRTTSGTRPRIAIGERTIAGLGEIVDRLNPDIVYAPFFLDPHPDHAAATRLLGAVMERGTSVKACYLYEVWTPLVPNALVDITPEAEVKRQAIDAHRSQVETINMSGGMLALNAYRAEMNRIRGYAEAYLRLGPRDLGQMLRELNCFRGAATSA